MKSKIEFHACAGHIYGSNHPFIAVGKRWFGGTCGDPVALAQGFATADEATDACGKLNSNPKSAERAFKSAVRVFAY